MFGRLTAVKLRTAEQALQEGRLDRAFEEITTSELADHRRARQLLSNLFEPLMNRAQEHLLGGRFREALLDLEKAERCGVASEKPAEWRARALAAMEQFNRRRQHQRQTVEAAADRLASGALTAAGRHLERLPDGAPQKVELMDEVAMRAERAGTSIRDADAALKSGQLAAAVDGLLAARRDHAGSAEARELAMAVLLRLEERAREAMSSGQLDRAAHDVALALRVEPASPALVELQRALKGAD